MWETWLRCVVLLQTSGIYSAFAGNQPTGYMLVSLPVAQVQSDLDPQATPFVPVVEETIQNTPSDVEM